MKVRVLLDADNAVDQYSSADYFANAGITVYLDAEHNEAHNKVMIVDGATVVTGSFNFTKAADEKNAENLLVLTGKPKLAAAYVRNFELHLKHAAAYKVKGDGQLNLLPPALCRLYATNGTGKRQLRATYIERDTLVRFVRLEERPIGSLVQWSIGRWNSTAGDLRTQRGGRRLVTRL